MGKKIENDRNCKRMKDAYKQISYETTRKMIISIKSYWELRKWRICEKILAREICVREDPTDNSSNDYNEKHRRKWSQN